MIDRVGAVRVLMFTSSGLFAAAAVGWASGDGIWMIIAVAAAGNAVILAVTAVRPAARLVPNQPPAVREEQRKKRPRLLMGVAVSLLAAVVSVVSGGMQLALFSLAVALFMLSVVLRS